MRDQHINRRAFLGKSVTTMGAASLAASVDPCNAMPVRQSSATQSSATQSSATQSIAMKIQWSPRRVWRTKGEIPCGMIGNVKISRLILGSNLMGGYSHSRDLSYVGPLMTHYNTEEKIMETLALAESEGINTISQGDAQLIKKYNERYGGNLQQLGPAQDP